MPYHPVTPYNVRRALLFAFCFTALVWTDSAAGERRIQHSLPDDREPFSAVCPADVDLPDSQVDDATRRRWLASLDDYVREPGVERLVRDDRFDDVGGDDVVIPVDDHVWTSIAITESGDIYIACSWEIIGEDCELRVYRSQDGGTTWTHWGTHDYADPSMYFMYPHCVVAEGTENRCFVAFSLHDLDGGADRIAVIWADLADEMASFTEQIVFDEPGVDFRWVRIESDVAAFPGYYLYLVADGWGGIDHDIWFARSIDRGESWETPYEIASMSHEDYYYQVPDIAYGYGGVVHVAWYLRVAGASSGAIRYRRALNYAGGGESSWDPIQVLTSISDDFNDHRPLVAASLTADDVGIYFRRGIDYQHIDPAFLASSDRGATFDVYAVVTDGIMRPYDLLWRPTTNTWIAVGEDVYDPDNFEATATHSAPVASPSSWTPVQMFADYNYHIGNTNPHNGALDPSRDYQLAVCWADWPTDEKILFDAEWRAEPGYPDTDPGRSRSTTCRAANPR